MHHHHAPNIIHAMKKRTRTLSQARPLLLGMLLCLSLAGCLDEQPRSQIDREKAYDSATSLYINTVATLYNYIGGAADSQGLQGTYRGVYDYNTFTTDEAIIPIRGGDWYDGGFWENLYLHRWTAADASLYDTWKYLYKVIVFCNEAIATIGAHHSLLTAAQQEAYTAEVRALRALFYWHLMDLYGNIPLLTAADTSLGEVRQSPRADVFKFIINELQAVENILPGEHSNLEGPWYGRMTRPVAHFLLAKLALNAEVYADNDWTDGARPDGRQIRFTVDGNALNAWQACVAYCDKLAADGYRLADGYADNFVVHNENSPENIFIIPMDKMLYANQFQYLFRSRHYAHGGALGMAAENGACATPSTVRAHGYRTAGEDPRYRLNFFSDTVKVSGRTVMLDNGQPLIYQPLAVEVNLTYSPYVKTAGARMAKYESDHTAHADGKLQDNDIVLFRYADALLMKAEAKVRNGEDGTAELNAVRRRAGMPASSATLENILQERLLELCWEGWRRNDLVRFDLFHRPYDLKPDASAEADRHTTVFPIPDDAISLNGNLRQNPGYK